MCYQGSYSFIKSKSKDFSTYFVFFTHTVVLTNMKHVSSLKLTFQGLLIFQELSKSVMQIQGLQHTLHFSLTLFY